MARGNDELHQAWKIANGHVRGAEERLASAWAAFADGSDGPPDTTMLEEVARLRRECDAKLTAILAEFRAESTLEPAVRFGSSAPRGLEDTPPPAERLHAATPIQTNTVRAAEILTDAIQKTDEVQEDLHEAAEALSDTNAVLSNPLTAAHAVAAVADALEQNIATETKVHDAAQELDAVKYLIQEAQVAQAEGDAKRHAGEGTASILAYFEGRRAQARDDEEKPGPAAPG